MTFRVLYVCTGNVCRSPMAELMLRTLASGYDIDIASVGMAALLGHEMDENAAYLMRELGIDPSGHRARQFEPRLAAGADLVLTAERGHRDAVMAEVPTTLRRAFTMKEFARLAAEIDPTEPAELVARAAYSRGIHGAVPARADDVPDAYLAPVAHTVVTARQILASVEATARALGLPVPSSGARSRPSPAPRSRPQPRAQA